MNRHFSFCALFISLAVALSASAATDFRILVDLDNNPSTGCIVNGMTGVERVLTTTFDATASAPRVTSLTRQDCLGSLLGSPVMLDATGWPATTNAATGLSIVETRIPLSEFGSPIPSSMRLGFVMTTAGQTVTVLTDADGNPILFPNTQKRHIVGTRPRVFIADGNPADWAGIDPIANGDATQPNTFRIVNVFGFLANEGAFFRFDAQSHSAAPTAHNDTYSTPLNTPLSVSGPGILGNDTDPNGLSLTAIQRTAPLRGALAMNADGSFTYTPDGGIPARESFTYQANNGTQSSNVARVEIRIGQTNHAPEAGDDAYNVVRGGTLNPPAPGVLQNDTDADGDTLHAVVRTAPLHGTLTLHDDGSFTYVNDGLATIDDTFTYVASDGIDVSREATVRIHVGTNNVPPQAVDDNYTVDEGATLNVPPPGVLSNDRDSDTAPAQLSAIMVTSPQHGTLTLNANGGFVYTHDGSETTSDTFTYRVSDRQASSNVATVHITINPVNDAPVAVNNSYTTLEDTTLTIAAPGVLGNDTDVDSPASSFTASVVTTTTNGTLTLNANGSFTYVPNANFFGTDSFTYRTSDGAAQSAPATVTIVVTPVNDAPSFTAGAAVTVLEDSAAYSQPWVVGSSAGPGETQNLNYIVSNNNNALFSVQPAISPAGVLTFTPAANANGVATVSVQIHDDGGTANGGVDTSATQTFTITVTAVNDAPSFLKGADQLVLDTAGAQTVAGWATNRLAGPPDEVGQLLNFIVSNNNNALFSVQPSINANGDLTYTPLAGAFGVATVTVQIHDNGGTANGGVDTSVAQTFTITVDKIPAITSANNTTFTVGTLGTFTVTTDGQPKGSIAITSGTLPSGVTFVDGTGPAKGTAVLSGTPDPGTGGVYNIQFTATNVHGSGTPQNFTLTVNQAPAITSANAATFDVGVAGTFTVTTSGFPAPSIARGGVALPNGVTFTDNGNGTGTLAGTPAAATGGTYAITFTATNVAGTSPAQSFTLTIRQAPAITSGNAATFTVGTPGTFTVTTTGFPAPSIARGGVALPSGINFVDNGDGTGTLSGTAAAATGGTYAITFTATNAVGSTPAQAFTLTINQAPAITSANTVTFDVGAFGTFTVTTSGFPAPSIARGGVALPGGVNFIDNGNGTGTLSGTPAAATGGSYAITFTATNVAGSSPAQNFTLIVRQPPAITSGNAATFTVGIAGTFTVTTTGFPAPSIARGGVALPGGINFVDNGDGTGTLSGTAAAATGGTYAITFTATNALGSTPAQAFTLTINQAPAITSANTVTFDVGAAGTFTVTTSGFPAPSIARGGVALPTGVNFVDNGNGTGTLSGTPAAATGGSYAITFTATNVAGSSPAQNFTLIVRQLPAITSANAVTFTAGIAGTFTVTTSGFPAPSIARGGVVLPSGITFVDNGDGTGTLGGTAAAGTGNTYAISFTATNSLGSSAAQPFTLTINEAPAITTPAADQTVCAGTNASFTAAASGVPAPTVQWQLSTDGGTTFNNIGGATSTTYTFVTAASDNGNKYRAVFTNVAGSASTTATLTVNTAAVVVTPPSNQTVCTGGTASFTVVTGGSPAPAVQWQLSTDGGGTFNNIVGATSPTYSFPATLADDTHQFRAVLTNVCATVNSAAATLTVDVAPAVTAQPSSATFCAGTTATFNATASGTPAPTVQWQVSPDGITFTNIVGATSTTYNFVASQADNNNQYRAVFTNGCASATSNAATITVTAAPAVTTQPVNQTICTGSPVTFTAAASGTPAPTVQWQISVNGGVTFTDIVGETATSYTFTTTSADNGHQFRAVFTNSCTPPATTNAATLTVTIPPAITAQPSNTSACAGSTASFTATASGTPAPTVQWQVSTDGGGSFSNIGGATSTTYTFTVLGTENNYQYKAVFTNSCGTATSNAATLTVNIAPAVTTNPVAQTVCAGATATFTAAASGVPAPTVQWQVSNGGPFTNIVGATSTTLSFTTVAGDNGKQYQAVFTNVCGTATTTPATLTVDTLPAVTTNPLTQTICAGSPVTFTAAATSNASDHTVQWQVAIGVGPFNDIAGATSTTLTFATAAGDNGNKYRAVFTDSCGSTNTTAATLTVDTLPVVTTNPSSQTLCAGATATFTAAATSNASDHTVQWQVSTGGPFSNIVGATSTTLSFTAVAGDNNKQYRAVFTDVCGSTNTTAATLTVDTLPVVTTNPLTQTSCAGSTVNFTAAATSNASDHTVQWQVSIAAGPFNNILGATSTTLSFASSAGDNGNQYRAVFTDSCGSTNTSAATLTVDTLPVVNVQPADTTVCAGATASFTAGATSNAGHSVQWQVSVAAGPFTNIVGATSTTLSFATVSGDNGNQYRAVFTNSCGSSTSNVATLTVNTAPAVTAQPSPTTVCENSTATFTASASGSPAPTVQWQVSTGGPFTDIVGATSTTLSFTATVADNNKQYHAVFTNACGTATTSAVLLTVNTIPVVTTQPVSQSVQAANTATFTAAASGTPAPTVQWESSPDGITFTPIVGATSTTLSFTAQLSDNAKQYRAVFTNSCGTATSNAATLTVTCPTITVARTGGGSFPNGIFNNAYAGQSVTASGSPGPFTFAVTLGALPTGLSLSSGGAISGTATATGTFNFTVTATDSGNGCTGSQAFSIKIAPVAIGDSYAAASNIIDNTQFVITGGTTATPATPFVGSIANLIGNDLPSGGVTATPGTVATTGGGSVTIALDGTFIYTPGVHAAAITSDSFQYTVDSNGVTSAAATVSLTLANRVWYVKNNGAAGNGQSQSPFNTLAAAQTASAAGDIIYIYNGDGLTTGQSLGITLKNNQQLIGEGVALVVNTVTLKVAGTKPQITNTTATSDVITLADGNTVKGLTVTGATRDGIAGNTHAGFTGDTLTIQTSTSAGLHLTSMTGTVTVTNTTFSGANGIGLDVNNGTAIITLDATNSITANATKRSVSIQNRPAAAGLITIGAPITDNGLGILVNNNLSGTIAFTGTQTLTTTTNTAVNLTTNTGTTINFSGTLSIVTTTGIGLNATGNGTLNITGTANVTTGAATTGVNINTVTVGASGVTFNSVNTTGATTGVSLTSIGNGNVTINGGTISGGTTGLSLNTLGTSTIALANVTITGSTTAISGTTFGTLSIGATVNVSGATALNLTTGVVSGTFANVTATAGSVLLNAVTGTWGTTAGAVTGVAATPAFSVTGGSGTITWGGSISQALANTVVTIVSSNSNTINFNGNVQTSGTGTGISISGSSGTYSFNGVTNSIAGSGGGIVIFNESGTITFSAGTSITAAATSFKIGGTATNVSANITYSGTITNGGGTLLDINSALGTFNGSLTMNGTSLTGSSAAVAGVISIINNVTGSVTVNNLSLTSSAVTFANTLVAIGGTNTAGSITFNHLTLSAPGNVANHNGKGLTMLGGGTLTITATGGASSIDVSSTALDLNGIALGVSAIGTLNSSGGVNGVLLTTVTGGALTIGAGTIAGQTGASFAVSGGTVSVTDSGSITQATAAQPLLSVTSHSVGTLTFQTGTLSATNGTGLVFANADGTYNFNGTTTLSGGAQININAGIDAVNGSQGTFTFVGGPGGTTITGGASAPFLYAGSKATVTYSGGITQATAAQPLVNVTSQPGGTITFQTGTLSATNGTGLQLSNVAGTITFSGTTTLNGGDAGIDVLTSTGVLSFASTTTITSPTGIGFNVSGGTPVILYSGTVTQANGNPAVTITGVTGGSTAGIATPYSILFNNTINKSGTAAIGVNVNANTGGSFGFTGNITASTTTQNAISLTTNTGATIDFTGVLTLTTTAGTGFNATGGGTVTARTSTTNVVTSVGGPAINIANTTIGANHVTFKTVNANGGASGIILNNTGASGSLHVNGGGSVTNGGDNSGGIIQNTTGRGVQLTSTTGVVLNNVKIDTTGDAGVGGAGVTDFTLTNSTVSNNGSNHTIRDSNVDFGTATGGAPTDNNVNGVVTITNNKLLTAWEHGIDIQNYAGTISNATISNNTITSTTSAATSSGSGIRLLGFGSAGGTSNITKATISSNTIANFPSGAGITSQYGNSAGAGGTWGTPNSATNIITISNNLINGFSAAVPMNTNAILCTLTGNGQAGWKVDNNGTVAQPISLVGGSYIGVTIRGVAPVASADITNNHITGMVSSSSQTIAYAVDFLSLPTDHPTLTGKITGNTISGQDGEGIQVLATSASSGIIGVTVSNNSITAPNCAGCNRFGMTINSGLSATVTGTPSICMKVTGNTAAGSGIDGGFGFRKRTGCTLNVDSFPSPGTDPSSFIAGLNTFAAPPAGGVTNITSSTAGSCTAP